MSVTQTAISRDDVLQTGTYGEFREKLHAYACEDCPLASQRTHLAIDRGNPRSQIMLIGEAPGATEDRLGKPFVGRAGKLLDTVMRETGFDTNKDCLVTNVVKCRPPNNRPPSRSEAEECLPYLLKQIELMKPRYILLLGATAARHLAKPGKGKPLPMRERVGRFFRLENFPGTLFMVLYHPAYLLRNPGKKKEMITHLETFKKDFKNQNSRAPKP